MAVSKRDYFYLRHILEAIADLAKFLRGVDYEAFSHSDLLQSAAMRKLEIMGEATKRLSIDFRREHADIPWKKIAGMRDVLIHDYFGVDVKAVWNTVKENIPDLKKKISVIIKSDTLI